MNLCRLLPVVTLLVFCGPAPAQPPNSPFAQPKPKAKPPDPKVEKVTKMLDDIASSRLMPASKRIEIARPLMEMGEEAFPAFEAILADPDSKPHIVRTAMEELVAMKSDKRWRFIDLVVGRLADESAMVRWKALVLLDEIGSERDTAPVVALLSDKEIEVKYSAARTLVKIGGKRDLVAMDAWLKAGAAHRDKKEFLDYVADCRRKLEARLNEKPKADGKN